MAVSEFRNKGGDGIICSVNIHRENQLSPSPPWVDYTEDKHRWVKWLSSETTCTCSSTNTRCSQERAAPLLLGYVELLADATLAIVMVSLAMIVYGSTGWNCLVGCMLCLSAGLSTNGQYFHVVEMERNSATLLLTKGFSLFSLKIHDRTIWLSDHRKRLVVVLSDILTNDSCAVIAAAISSSLGKECFLSSATLDFDITSVELVPCCRYTTAPYTRRLASAKMCKVNSDVDEIHCLGNGSPLYHWWFGSKFSSLRLVPLFMCCCHRVWRNNFAEMVTGEICTKGSKIVEAYFSTLLL